MRIAQIAPLYESVPPRGYGGTERIVHYLTEELVRLGHDVTLYASGDSQTSARLVKSAPRSLREDESCRDPIARHVLMLEQVARQHDRHDILHFHIDYLHYPLSRCLGLRQLTTLHGRLDLAELQDLHAAYPEMPVVSISDAQRAPLPHANWLGTVLHGLPLELVPFREEPEAQAYLAFVGRISREKRVDRAVEIAQALGVPLRIAAKIDPRDRAYFAEVAELFDHPLVEYLGELSDRDKSALVAGSRALLFPIDWPEPFGLVMIEAMACGTPVIAFDHGSVREVVDHGVTGFIVGDLPAAIEAARQAERLDRRVIRATFERRFGAGRMAREYLGLYRELLVQSSRQGRRVGAP